MRTKDEWKYFRDDKQFYKRCLFDSDVDKNIHLRSLDTLSNRHLLDTNLKLPFEDDVFRKIGQKKLISNQRNSLEERSPGDKTYKVSEYSKEFYNKKNRNWRSEKYELPKKSEETMSNDLIKLLNMDETINLFSNKYEFGYEIDLKSERKRRN